jgi:hypothetical protein
MTGGERRAYRRGLDQLEVMAAQHADWLMCIRLGHRWASAFGPGVGWTTDDGLVLQSRPLVRYALDLARLDSELMDAAAKWTRSLEDPAAAAAARPVSPLLPPPRDGQVCPVSLVGFQPHYLEGLDYIGAFEAASPHLWTPRDAWAAQVADAPHFLSAAGIRTDGLHVYVDAVQQVLNKAYETAQATYAGAVAATFGRLLMRTWDHGAQGNALVLWMRALAHGGIGVGQRNAVLRGLEPAFGEAVARCRAAMDHWLSDQANEVD